ERLPGDRAGEGIVGPGMPATGFRIEAEALVGAEQDVEEPRAELGVAALSREHQGEQLARRRPIRSLEQVLVKPLPHRRQALVRPSEREEAATLGGRTRSPLARRDGPQLLLEPRHLLALPFLALRQLTLPLVAHALEGAAPALVKPSQRLRHGAQHAQRGDEGPEAVRAAKDRSGTIAHERNGVLALAAEAADRHLPRLQRWYRERGAELLGGGRLRGGGGRCRGRRLRGRCGGRSGCPRRGRGGLPPCPW